MEYDDDYYEDVYEDILHEEPHQTDDAFTRRAETSGGQPYVEDDIDDIDDADDVDEPVTGFGGATITSQRGFKDQAYVAAKDVNFPGIEMTDRQRAVIRNRWEIARDVIKRILESLYGKTAPSSKSFSEITGIVAKIGNDKLTSYNPVLLALGFHFWATTTNATNRDVSKATFTKWKTSLKKNEELLKMVNVTQLSDADILRYIYITEDVLGNGSVAGDCF